MNQPPRLVRSELTGGVYVVMRYKEQPDGRIVAQLKHDVTEDFNALVSAIAEERTAFSRDSKGATISHGVGPGGVGVQHVIGEPCEECDSDSPAEIDRRLAPDPQ